MFVIENSGDQLFVYHNEELIYKRWNKLDHGRVFDLHGFPFVPGKEKRLSGA